METDCKKVVRYLWGPPRSGKTSAVRSRVSSEDLYVLTVGTGSSKSVWFNGYSGQKALLIDDFRGNLKVNIWLGLLDIYPIRVDFKGGMFLVNFESVYITANASIETFYGVVDYMTREAVYSRVDHQSACIDAQSIYVEQVTGERYQLPEEGER